MITRARSRSVRGAGSSRAAVVAGGGVGVGGSQSSASASPSPSPRTKKSAPRKRAKKALEEGLVDGVDAVVPMETGDFFLFCPYASCGGSMVDPSCFYDHVMEAHQKEERQDFLCPICVTFYGVDPASVNKTALNLLNHMREAHSDMAGASSSLYAPVGGAGAGGALTNTAVQEEEEPYVEPDVYNNSNLGSEFAEFTLDREMGPDCECAVCLGTFIKGQNVVRMECFCMYHTMCVQLWWTKKKRTCCPSHIHYEVDDE